MFSNICATLFLLKNDSCCILCLYHTVWYDNAYLGCSMVLDVYPLANTSPAKRVYLKYLPLLWVFDELVHMLPVLTRLPNIHGCRAINNHIQNEERWTSETQLTPSFERLDKQRARFHSHRHFGLRVKEHPTCARLTLLFIRILHWSKGLSDTRDGF